MKVKYDTLEGLADFIQITYKNNNVKCKFESRIQLIKTNNYKLYLVSKQRL